jgi:hypothetical protein
MEPCVESIRELVHRTLQELALEDTQPLGETLLTLAGYYVGHEFRFDGVRVVWIASQGQVKFYGDDGQALRVVEISEAKDKRAA